MQKLAERIDARSVRVVAVENLFFGGSVNGGGPPNVRDFLHVSRQLGYLDQFDVAFTTRRFLGPDGETLVGEHWIRIERDFGLLFYFL